MPLNTTIRKTAKLVRRGENLSTARAHALSAEKRGTNLAEAETMPRASIVPWVDTFFPPTTTFRRSTICKTACSAREAQNLPPRQRHATCAREGDFRIKTVLRVQRASFVSKVASLSTRASRARFARRENINPKTQWPLRAAASVRKADTKIKKGPARMFKGKRAEAC